MGVNNWWPMQIERKLEKLGENMRRKTEIVIRGVVCQVVGSTCQLLGLPTPNSDQALQGEEKEENSRATNQQRIVRKVGKVLLCANWVSGLGDARWRNSQAMETMPAKLQADSSSLFSFPISMMHFPPSPSPNK